MNWLVRQKQTRSSSCDCTDSCKCKKTPAKMGSPLKCWKTHERKPGTVKGAKGSCQHKDPSKRPENK